MEDISISLAKIIVFDFIIKQATSWAGMGGYFHYVFGNLVKKLAEQVWFNSRGEQADDCSDLWNLPLSNKAILPPENHHCFKDTGRFPAPHLFKYR